MGPGHVGEDCAMAPLGPQQNWAQGASNSPHGPWTAAYGPWTVGHQNLKMAKNGHTSSLHHFHHKIQKKAQMDIKSFLSKKHSSKGQGPE
ncbi:hypothetical protein O181_030049 [Austropuccinia psidii MF-1]|uniref:Uncharacterized protein n=1 Tax=Austropuccinia psidii MF-1 TaxID=1389203 RepID=A0A9Q3CS34_9BASI|nr:hypothetical protein [Austropuccinia psidii MF-1]